MSKRFITILNSKKEVSYSFIKYWDLDPYGIGEMSHRKCVQHEMNDYAG
jgi:hypothetical protein